MLDPKKGYPGSVAVNDDEGGGDRRSSAILWTDRLGGQEPEGGVSNRTHPLRVPLGRNPLRR